MPPGFVPPRTAQPRPAKAKISKPKAPVMPKTPKPKPIDPNQVATQNAMNAFHTALNQLKASTPAVDANAIYAPYRASQQVTGQLGQGLQSSLLAGGQAAQNQYAAGRDAAQQQAAAFGISAGAGANPTALQDNGTQLLAQQTQAQAAAAPQAAAQWQALLERTAAGKVSDANLQRQNSLVSGEQQLAGNLPSAIANEKQLGFQQDTARKNFALAVGTAEDKRTNELRDYLLGVTKAQTAATTAATRAEQTATANAEKARHNRAAETIASKKLAASQKAATASGIKGISQAQSILKTTKGSSTQKVAKGWDVQVQPIDPDTGDVSGNVQRIHVADKRKIPAGFKAVGTATTHWETGPGKAGGGVSLAQWNQALAVLKSQNPGVAPGKLIPLLPPKPKK